MSEDVLQVYDTDSQEGWAFAWEDARGEFVLEWLPHKNQRGQWQRAFRPGKVGGWSMQAQDGLEEPRSYDDARRIAKEHAAQGPRRILGDG